jgi:hypothetical protein
MSLVLQQPDTLTRLSAQVRTVFGLRTLSWMAAIVAALGAAALITSSASLRNVEPAWRLNVANSATIGLFFIAAVATLLAIRADRAPVRVWGRAIAASLLIAALGLTMVGTYGLIPPPLEYSRYRAWDYTDKRWLVVLYLLCAGLVYMPSVLRRLLGDAEQHSVVASTLPAAAVGRRIAFAALVGAILSALYMAPFLPSDLQRFMDPHEHVHLGGFQRIAQGATPYLDAQTQYGPGYQLLTFWIMRHTGITLYGFRLSQAWLNIIGVATLFSVWLAAYGSRKGAAIIVASLILSPLLMVTWWGWVVILRWVGPVLVGALVPLLIWRSTTQRVRDLSVSALGLACGVLAWIAQENLTGPIITLFLLLGAAYGRGSLSLLSALRIAGIFVVSQVATFIILMLASFGLGGFGQAMSLYFHSTGLVFQGMTNTPWSEPQSTWRRAYPATPIVIILTTAVALYRRPARTDQQERENGQLLGIAAAAVPLTMITLFRADGPHFVATATALPALVVLAIAILPGEFRWRLDRANALRIAMIAASLVLYFNPLGNYWTRTHNSRSFADPRLIGNPTATMEGLRILASSPQSVPSSDPILAKLGFIPASEARCCYVLPGTWKEWNVTMRQVHQMAAGRSVFVDVGPPLETSGILFLADLRSSSSYVSEMMSVWTDADLRTLDTEFRARPPDCMLSSGRNRPLTMSALRIYGNFSTTAVPGIGGMTLYCRRQAS